MVFSSIVFLFAFLPAVLLLYHLISIPVWIGSTAKRWRQIGNLFLLFVSLIFYFWGEKFLVWIFICTVFIDYVCALLISAPISGAMFSRDFECLKPGASRSPLQRTVLITSIVSNLSLLGFFKYFNFGVDTFNAVAGKLAFRSLIWSSGPKILLPLGISFFVFHSMSYTIDVYRGYVKATRNLVDYASYVLMFPQLVAGPIVRYSLVARQLVERRMSTEIFASGAGRFLSGLSKKVLIANLASILSDRMFALPEQDVHFTFAWLGMIAYTIQIYFDFSGYSDMAVGLGRMLGFELPINFDYPYTSTSIREFWRKWHISLSTWFRDYLYLPLGGNRRAPVRAFCNLLTVFFLCGLWHGARWTFVVWGLYHGLFLVLERLGLESILGRLVFARRIYTLLVIIVGWVFFRADTFAQAIGILRAMAGFNPGVSDYPIQWFVSTDIWLSLACGTILCAPIVPAAQRLLGRIVSGAGEGKRRIYLGLFCGLRLSCASAAMVLCAASLASGTHNPFIYFRF